MPEVQTLNELTDRIDEKKYPHGICPLMSTVQFVPMQDSLAMGQAVPVAMPGFAPCLGEKCKLWHRKSCSVGSDIDLENAVDAIAQMLAYIADSLKNITDSLDRAYPKFKPV